MACGVHILKNKNVIEYELEEIISGLAEILKEFKENNNLATCETVQYYFEHLYSILNLFPKKEKQNAL